MKQLIRIIGTSFRHGFYRGETAQLKFNILNFHPVTLYDCTLTARLGDFYEQKIALPQVPGIVNDQEFTIPTALFHCGVYQLQLQLTQGEKTLGANEFELLIAPPRRPNQLALWHWPATVHYNALEADENSAREQIDLLANLGFTMAQFRINWGTRHPDAAARLIEYAMGRGIELGILVENTGGGQFKQDAETPENCELITVDGETTNLVNTAAPAMRQLLTLRTATWLRQFAQFPSCSSCFMNSEVEDRLKLPGDFASRLRHEKALGFPLGLVRRIDCIFDPALTGTAWVQRGVIADDDPDYLYTRYYFQHGDNFADTNALMAEVVHRYRPDMTVITDPLRNCAVYDRFPKIDAISSWTYTNPDPKMMLYIETLQCAATPDQQQTIPTVTLWNYAGTLVPCGDDRFARELTLRMEPDRFKECAWLNFSRAPQAIGVYFGSPIEPNLKGGDPFIYSPETENAIAEFAREVLQPLGEFARATVKVPRRIAVLDSLASRVYPNSPRSFMHYPNYQIYNFYTLLAMAQLPSDVIFDETVTPAALKKYDMVVLPHCETLTQSVYQTLVAFAKQGGIVVADQYLRADIPGAIHLNFDFEYRKQVNANANTYQSDFAVKDDTNFRAEWGGKTQVQGVTALEDQEIMERYAAQLRTVLDGKIARDYDCSSPRLLLNAREFHGVRYLFVVNDHRTWGDRVKKWKSMLEKGLPETAVITLRDPGFVPTVYDLVDHQKLAVEAADGNYKVKLTVPAASGAVLAILPAPLRPIQITMPEAVLVGENVKFILQSAPHSGLLPLRVEFRAPDGQFGDETNFYLLRDGLLELNFTAPANRPTGEWELQVVNLADNNVTVKTFTVSAQ